MATTPPTQANPPSPPAVTFGRPDLPKRKVCSGLSLWFKLKSPDLMGPLLQYLKLNQDKIDNGLARLHYVHYSRFLPAPDWTALQVITEFDGEFDAYVLDFVHVIGDQFDRILRDVDGAPTASVKDRPDLFIDFIRRSQIGAHGPLSVPVRQNSAYADLTVIDIIGAGGVQPKAVAPRLDTVTLADVQANVLRGVTSPHVRHVGLRIDGVAGARAFLGVLLLGTRALPMVSDGGDWASDAQGNPVVPDFQLTVGLTFKALAWLGVDAVDLEAFKCAFPAFVRGPEHAGNAQVLGDVGDSAPGRWRYGGPRAQVHLVVSLYGKTDGLLDGAETALRALAAASGLTVVDVQRADVMKNAAGQSIVHFDYADGLSAPHVAVAGGAPHDPPDMQPSAAVGEVLLGARYQNGYRGEGSLGGLSEALATNATFAALRLMKQDVAAFEALLAQTASASGQSTDWVAAKLMGRWRNGTALADNPVNNTPTNAKQLNNFDYAQKEGDTTTFNDDQGLRCPIGAHVRRMNPRSGVVAGQPFSRRVLRRGMPYGPAYTAEAANDERGLVGLFLCSDLDRQFEVMLRQWAQGDMATRGVRQQQDPIIGAQTTLDKLEDSFHPMNGTYSIPTIPTIPTVPDLSLPRLVQTVGSAYLFMPGINGLRYLRDLTSPAAATVLSGGGKPGLFDPTDYAVYSNPFPYHAWFRAHQPVAHLPALRTVWVFDNANLKAALDAVDLATGAKVFARQQPGRRKPVGLLKMDPPGHAVARTAVQPLFRLATTAAIAKVGARVTQLYGHCQAQPQPVDWVADFAQPLAEAVFSDWYGLGPGIAPTQPPPAEILLHPVRTLLGLATQVLEAASPNDDTAADRANAEAFDNLKLLLGSIKESTVVLPGGLFQRLFGLLVASERPPAEPRNEFGLIEFLAQTTTLATAGYLPMMWAVSLVTWHLLENNGALLTQLCGDPAITTRAAVDELLRFDMPTPMSTRYAQFDGVLGGVAVKRGEKLMLSWASANRDPVRFGPNADVVDFNRGLGNGWAFGNPSPVGGDSFECLGRDLSYAVLDAVVDALRMAATPASLVSNHAPEWTDAAMFRALKTLPVNVP